MEARIRQWMRYAMSRYHYGQEFDLAVDCTSDLNLWEEDMSIPQRVIEIAEELFEQVS